MRRTHCAFLAALLPAGLLLSAAVAAPPAQHDPASEPAFQEGQIWDVGHHRLLSLEELIAGLASRQVIYLGEEHRNHWHVESALMILRALISRGLRPVLALEMFGWDGQTALDRLSDSDMTPDRLLKESRWEQNWGGSYDDYEPLVRLAREARLPLLALNPPRTLVRLVASRGLAQALTDPDMARWDMTEETFADEPAYRDLIDRQLHLCHGGLSDDAYQRMYEASVFRDEGMAKTIAESLDHTGGSIEPSDRPHGPVVSYTGGGHIQYQLPVPRRVLRRRSGSVEQATIYMTAFDPARTDEIRALFKDAVADYLWLTPVGAHGVPRRCP